MEVEKVQQIKELLDSFKLANNLLEIKDFNTENFNTLSSKLIDFVNIPKIKSSQRLSLKLNFINNFNEAIESNLRSDRTDALYKYLIFNKISEILRLNEKPMIFLTLLKNSLSGEPNYNIIQKLKTQKGYQIHKILNILFSNIDDMLEFIKIQQITLQLKLDFNDILLGLLKTVVMDLYYSLYFITGNQKYYFVVSNLELFRIEIYNNEKLCNDLESYLEHYNMLIDDLKNELLSTKTVVI